MIHYIHDLASLYRLSSCARLLGAAGKHHEAPGGFNAMLEPAEMQPSWSKLGALEGKCGHCRRHVNCRSTLLTQNISSIEKHRGHTHILYGLFGLQAYNFANIEML